MLDGLTKFVIGRSLYSTLYLVVFMVVAPAAVFTDYEWLDGLAWGMLIFLGVLVFIAGIIVRQEAANSHHWPTVEAKLISCSMIATIGKDHKAYMPNVKCSFQLDGREYSGTEYDFSSAYTRKDIAQKKVDTLRKRDTLLVHYKPTDPTVNVIHPGVHYTHYIRVIVGIGMVVVPVLILLGYIELAGAKP